MNNALDGTLNKLSKGTLAMGLSKGRFEPNEIQYIIRIEKS